MKWSTRNVFSGKSHFLKIHKNYGLFETSCYLFRWYGRKWLAIAFCRIAEADRLIFVRDISDIPNHIGVVYVVIKQTLDIIKEIWSHMYAIKSDLPIKSNIQMLSLFAQQHHLDCNLFFWIWTRHTSFHWQLSVKDIKTKFSMSIWK